MQISYFELFSDIENKLKKHDDILILTSSDKESTSIANYLTISIDKGVGIYNFPSNDIMPYDRVSPSQKIKAERAYILSKLVDSNSHEKRVLVTKYSNLTSKIPSKSYFADKYLKLNVKNKFKIDEILSFLVKNNYVSSSVAVDAGEFSKRGDILDIVLYDGRAYRINFLWDEIESIKFYDPTTQLSKNKVDFVELYPASEVFLNEKTIENFRSTYLKQFGVQQSSNSFYENITLGIHVAGIESFSPVLYSNPVSLIDYLNSPKIFKMKLSDNSLEEYYSEYDDIYKSRITANKESDNFYPAFAPNILIYNKKIVEDAVCDNDVITFEHTENTSQIPDFYTSSITLKKETAIKQLIDFSEKNLNKKTIIFCSSIAYLEKIKSILDIDEIPYREINHVKESKKNIFNLIQLPFEYSFSNKNYIFIADKHILGERVISKKPSEKRLKNIFQELENFSEGDLVAHIEHGIGMFKGIQHLDVSGNKHDCLLLEYNKGDKLYIPVENIHLIKRFGDNTAQLDNLGSVSWQKRKSKLKERIGELALRLMKVAAKRKIIKTLPIKIDQEEYKNFILKFPYSETEDQIRAIEDIENDLKSDHPMDRLICGDVGFGKTEVAIRAAYQVASDKAEKKQVAIIVPTTILARQHYENFKLRFKGFNVKIAQLSRLVSTKEAKNIKEDLKEGRIDILIGTHAVLAESVKFKNLSLVIVDEEQHFGVSQKEKLKELQTGVHTLTLTATPIPRTLQMSMIGIRELSLIATPPVDRLSVKTSVISFDDVIIREALLREKFRGGKSFFVAPRISDLENLENKIKEIAPELSFKIAHGQMAASTIDKIMTEFYDGAFDILLSTAIVESGLDIPSANTMIIYKAENMGLSQLYQLRGRVGRGKLRGFAYLVTDNRKMPTKSAVKRLQIMESIESLGAGFSIASQDMDQRGFGNLVGDEQSGHIKEVGAELYQDMLEEEIARLQNKEIKDTQMPDINLKAEIYIPDDYIKDQASRLAIYRRAGDITNIDEISDFEYELIDRFGKLPDPVKNLLELIRIRIICKNLGVKQIDMGAGGFNVKFNNEINPDNIMKFISNYQNNTKLKPDNKLIFTKKIDLTDSINETKSLINKISEHFQ